MKNASFQRLFALPSEEFLVNDFSCSLKRKILLQVGISFHLLLKKLFEE
jgi:hypothetical protein